MSVSLSKDEVVVLAKVAPALTKVTVGLGWLPADSATAGGKKFDLDGSAFLLSGGKVNSDAGFIYFNNKMSLDGSVVHQGDNRTGEGEGDDEKIDINLSTVSSEVDSIAIAVTIFDAANRGQTFADINSTFVRLVNSETDEEVARYDLTGYGAETGFIFGELKRTPDGWQFTAVGQPVAGELRGVAASYGVNV